MSKKKKYLNGIMPMFQGGTLPMPPMPPIPPMPFMPFAPSQNTRSQGGDKAKEKFTKKENFNSTLKSFWTQNLDMQQSSVENSKEQWKQFFNYITEMEDTFAASLPDDLSALPFAKLLPMTPKAFMEQLKDFQEMANDHLMEQAESFADFCIKGQKQFYDLVSTAMENKAAKERAALEEQDQADDDSDNQDDED